MEKIRRKKNYSRSYGPVVVWLEHLKEIVTILGESAQDVQISTKDYRFKDLEELQDHIGTQATFELELDASNPNVSVEFSKMAARVFVGSGAQAAYVFQEIDGVLTGCQRRFPLLYKFWFLVSVSTALLAVSILYFRNETDLSALLFTGVQFVACLWFLWACYIVLQRTSVIRLQRRTETRPFLERNKDQLLILLLGAILGGFVTFGGVVAKEHFYPSAPAACSSRPS